MHTMIMGLFEKFGQKNLFSLASRKLATFFTHFEDRWKVTNWPKKLIPIVLSSNFNSPFFFFFAGDISSQNYTQKTACWKIKVCLFHLNGISLYISCWIWNLHSSLLMLSKAIASWNTVHHYLCALKIKLNNHRI